MHDLAKHQRSEYRAYWLHSEDDAYHIAVYVLLLGLLGKEGGDYSEAEVSDDGSGEEDPEDGLHVEDRHEELCDFIDVLINVLIVD